MGNNVVPPVCDGENYQTDDLVLAPCIEHSVLGHLETIPTARGALCREQDVLLNIYHLDDNWKDANHVSKQLFGLGGAFHVGIEVAGREWTYGVAGITCAQPRSHQVHVYHESILLGETSLSPKQVQALIARMGRQWLGEDYNMLDKNCCSFADALSLSLVGDHIPQWVTRFPHLASKAAAHLDHIVDVKGLMQDSVAPMGPYDMNREDSLPAMMQRPHAGYARAVRAH